MSNNGRPPLQPSLILDRLGRNIRKQDCLVELVCLFLRFVWQACLQRTILRRPNWSREQQALFTIARRRQACHKKRSNSWESLLFSSPIWTAQDCLLKTSSQNKLKKLANKFFKPILKFWTLRLNSCVSGSICKIMVKKCFTVASHRWMSSSTSYTDPG